MKKFFFVILIVIFLCSNSESWSQQFDKKLIPQMESYELDIQKTYQEYQKMYYEKKTSLAELGAFENIITVYVTQILEIYETLNLSGFENLVIPRDIAARALVYRALIYLEKAPLNIEYFERACYDYYSALEMFENVTDSIPAIFKQLPHHILVGNHEYSRLIDVIDYKGSELYAFGKVRLNLKNFKITTNLDIEDLEFIRIDSPLDKKKYTYLNAEKRIKDTFRKILTEDGKISTFLALPEGTYCIRSRNNNNLPRHIFLSTLYVRANQQHNYIVEPLTSWFIMYELPNTKKPKLNLVQYPSSKISGEKSEPQKLEKGNSSEKNEINYIISSITNNFDKIDNKQIFNSNNATMPNNFPNILANIIYSNIKAVNYYNSWSMWMLAWIISKEFSNSIDSNIAISSELIKLIYIVLNEL